MDETRTASHRGAWNKGKLVGQKAPFKLQEIWAIAFACRCRVGCATLPCSTWSSTVSCAPVTCNTWASVGVPENSLRQTML